VNRDYAIVIRGVVRCYVWGTRAQARAEFDRIMRGIEADARLMGRR